MRHRNAERLHGKEGVCNASHHEAAAQRESLGVAPLPLWIRDAFDGAPDRVAQQPHGHDEQQDLAEGVIYDFAKGALGAGHLAARSE